MNILNWQLIGNPLNWVIIILMLLFASFLAHIVIPQLFNQQTTN